MRTAIIAILFAVIIAGSLAANGATVEVTRENVKAHITTENIMNMIREKENRTYVFQLLKNTTMDSQTKVMIKKQIMITLKENKEFRNQLMNNKTMLVELVPEYKNLIEKSKIENITVNIEGDHALMKIKVKEQRKLFGIIPIEIPEEIITNETTAKLKRPWWAILTI